jgi:hypothetical protein
VVNQPLDEDDKGYITRGDAIERVLERRESFEKN